MDSITTRSCCKDTAFVLRSVRTVRDGAGDPAAQAAAKRAMPGTPEGFVTPMFFFILVPQALWEHHGVLAFRVNRMCLYSARGQARAHESPKRSHTERRSFQGGTPTTWATLFKNPRLPFQGVFRISIKALERLVLQSSVLITKRHAAVGISGAVLLPPLVHSTLLHIKVSLCRIWYSSRFWRADEVRCGLSNLRVGNSKAHFSAGPTEVESRVYRFPKP